MMSRTFGIAAALVLVSSITLAGLIVVVCQSGAPVASSNTWANSLINAAGRMLFGADRQLPDHFPGLSTFDDFGRLVSHAGKVKVPCPQQGSRTAVFVIAGQSNAANFAGQRYTSAHGAQILNFFNGDCFIAASPLLGTSESRGEYWTRMANILVSMGKFDTVVLAPIAIDASNIARWARGGDLNGLMLTALANVHRQGYRVTHVLWHQGEADLIMGTSRSQYEANFQSVVDTLRTSGLDAPIFVSITSKCSSVAPYMAGNPIALAQAGLPDAGRGIVTGVNTDRLLDDSDRYDDCHFAGSGAEKVAAEWSRIIAAHPMNDGVQQ